MHPSLHLRCQSHLLPDPWTDQHIDFAEHHTVGQCLRSNPGLFRQASAHRSTSHFVLGQPFLHNRRTLRGLEVRSSAASKGLPQFASFSDGSDSRVGTSSRDMGSGAEPGRSQNGAQSSNTLAAGDQAWQLRHSSGPGVLTDREKDKDEQAAASTLQGALGYRIHWAMALGALFLLEKSLAKAVAAAGITFPSALIGMFGIIATLGAVTAVAPDASDAISAWFSPALNWIQKWLPLFYVPSLVVLPLVVQGIPGMELAKVVGLIMVMLVVTLLTTAQIAVSIRAATNTEMLEQPPEKPQPPFARIYYTAWAAVVAAMLVGSRALPPSLAANAAVIFMLASTVLGYLLGTAVPAGLRRILHPLIGCGLLTNVAAAGLGAVNGQGYKGVLRSYLTKGAGPAGAGDLLMSVLGVVILSFGFRIFAQRRLMLRHAPEIFGSTFSSCLVSMFGTAFAARAIGLAPGLARACVPKSVTVALALPIAQILDAPLSITAATVMLTGLLGANLVQPLLDRFGYRDPIARGLSTAATAHGMGTAALAAKEPEALPFCALAYALVGIMSTVLAGTPAVSSALLAITG